MLRMCVCECVCLHCLRASLLFQISCVLSLVLLLRLLWFAFVCICCRWYFVLFVLSVSLRTQFAGLMRHW